MAKSAKNSAQKKAFPIVGIGGSAGSFSSFEKFFSKMPPDTGMAFVVVMHLDPHYKSQLSDVFQLYTTMDVLEATDGITIVPDKVYIIPANKDMGIHNRRLLLLNPSRPKGIRQPIDYFFQSLAEDQWNKAIAIIFSGMGTDGETGVRMIKEKLGLIAVQDPKTAEFESMPMAAISTNLVDYILSPEEMPLKLIQYLNHPVISEETSDQRKSSIQNTNAIQKILMLLRSQTGNDFALYKKSTITRRIDRRLAFHQLSNYEQYVQYIKDNPQEIDVLFNELLIGVTKFFRDTQAFDSLKENLQMLLQQKGADDSFRVWVSGCSTGEEAYSIAILLAECIGEMEPDQVPRLQIYATDLDAEALDHARNGMYLGNIVADVTPERLNRFFVKSEQNFIVKKELRETIIFAQHNLIKDAPFIKLDLLCCRNMLIYFTGDLQKKIIPLFYYALNPKGLMFMGPAETIGGFTDLFSVADPKWKLFTRREGNMSVGKITSFPFHISQQNFNFSKNNEVDLPMNQRSVVDIFSKTLIDQFTPASVLVNDKGDILYSNGKSGKYLELASGEAHMNIHKMAREELKYVLGNAIQEALMTDSTVVAEKIKLKERNRVELVSIKAVSIKLEGIQQLVLVVFEDLGLLRKAKDSTLHHGSKNGDSEADELKKELVYTKLRLNSTIEQMESSLEELKSTNEELQITNEELQSTNEESLTTKEEMQSLNEELMTMNLQYQSKADELSRLNNDMKNLLDATEIGTIFLDNNMDILRYTPQVRQLFNLIPTDIGRPIGHVVTNFEQPFDEIEIKEVIDKLSIKVLDVKTKSGEWYRVRIMPYRTLDNFISGAVLTFTLITDYKHMQSRLSVQRDYSLSLMNSIPEPVCQLSSAFHVIQANDRFLKLFNLRKEDIVNINLGEFLQEQWKTEQPARLLKQCLDKKEPIEGKIDATDKTYHLAVSPFFEDTDTTLLIVVRIYEKPTGK